MEEGTRRRVRAASAMIVGLEAAGAEACAEALSGFGYRVVTVGHVAAACERMAVVMPLVVVGDANATERERDDLRDRAVAVGAELVWLPPASEASFAMATLRLVAKAALERHDG